VGRYVIWLLLVGLAAVVVPLNIWNHRHRRNMTPEEKRKEDAELHIPGDW
jgi:hypothetical protein